MQNDIRWKQRFDNYKRALNNLEKAEILAKERNLSKLEKQGLIQAFEFTHELAWNVLKDYLETKGFMDIHGSRDSTRVAFKEGYIQNGEVWMDMIKSRNESSHTYDETTANKLAKVILESYLQEFKTLRNTMQKLTDDL
ncbi:MAG: nucleotidyltransferase substrate binding protein [Endomicrobium sp.]|nr:nucleotidyltransferase substrate binding protein [Endomicrobium sp.]